MGQDKLALELGGVPLIVRVYRALEPRCEELILVGARDAPLPASVRRVPDVRPERLGPLAGVEAALLAARHRAVFVAAGDMPFLSEALVGGLLDMLSAHRASAVAPRYGGRAHPLCAAYDCDAVLPVVSAALDSGRLAVRDALAGLPDVLYVEERELRAFGEPERLLANVNSPEDLKQARTVLGEPPGGER